MKEIDELKKRITDLEEKVATIETKLKLYHGRLGKKYVRDNPCDLNRVGFKSKNK